MQEYIRFRMGYGPWVRFKGYSLHIVIEYPIMSTYCECLGCFTIFGELSNLLSAFLCIPGIPCYRHSKWRMVSHKILRTSGDISLQWRHNRRDGVSNHQHHHCLVKRLFRCRSKKTSKFQRHWPLCGEFSGDRWIPSQMASNAENVATWWRLHVIGDDKVDNI